VILFKDFLPSTVGENVEARLQLLGTALPVCLIFCRL
jgi:hypothetical protein